MSGEVVPYHPGPGNEIALTDHLDLPPMETLEQVHAYLRALLDAHPEFTSGIAVEVWPDGRKRARRGGMWAQRGMVTTISHVDNVETSYLGGR